MSSESREAAARNYAIKITLAKMLAGGMIVVVKNQDEAYVAESYGARAMIPIELTNAQNISKNSNYFETDLAYIEELMEYVIIPVVARVRVGHTAEAQAYEEGRVSFIYEYGGYIPTGTEFILKHPFKIPFIAEAANLTEALKRIKEGTSLVCTKYENDDDTANTTKTFNCVRAIFKEITKVCEGDDVYVTQFAIQADVPKDLVKMVARQGKLPVPFFAAGGIFNPIDVAMFMDMGCNGVIISNRVFNVIDPETRLGKIARALVDYNDPLKVMDLMAGISHTRTTGG